MTGLPRARANWLACCRASAALTVKRSDLIMVVYGVADGESNVCAGQKCRFGRRSLLSEEGASGAPRLDSRALDRSEAHVEGDASRALPVYPRRDARTCRRSRPPRKAIHAEQHRCRAHAGVQEPERLPGARF